MSAHSIPLYPKKQIIVKMQENISLFPSLFQKEVPTQFADRSLRVVTPSRAWPGLARADRSGAERCGGEKEPVKFSAFQLLPRRTRIASVRFSRFPPQARSPPRSLESDHVITSSGDLDEDHHIAGSVRVGCRLFTSNLVCSLLLHIQFRTKRAPCDVALRGARGRG